VARLHLLARDGVGFEHVHAVFAKHSGDGGFTAAKSASESCA
jgi:hypothetical protein